MTELASKDVIKFKSKVTTGWPGKKFLVLFLQLETYALRYFAVLDFFGHLVSLILYFFKIVETRLEYDKLGVEPKLFVDIRNKKSFHFIKVDNSKQKML